MTAPIVIPPEKLAPTTLRKLVEEFVSRDGTDYGCQEISLEIKTEQVLEQVRAGQVIVIFDTASDSCNLITSTEARLWHLGGGGKA